MKITNAIVWDHRGRTPKGGKGQLEVRITIDRKSYYIGTGIKVHKNELLAGQIVNCPGARELNDRLVIIYSKVLACVNDCIERGAAIDTKEIRDAVWRLVEENSDEPTLLNWINDQLPKLDIKAGTRRHYVSLQNKLETYGRLRKWRDVTLEGIVEFDAWLHSLTNTQVGGRLGDGLSDAAIYNYHKCLKALLRRAEMFEKIDRNPYDRLRGQFKRGERENVEYLTEDDMDAITRLDLPVGSIQDRCRDLFVFQMWTGLAYTDAQNFDIDQYKLVDGRWVNTAERVKTGVPYVSVLLSPAVEVLEKYGWKVPRIENHVYNRILKVIGMMAGIKTPLHSHLARHTFATYMLRNGSRIENVSRMLGHKSITQTQHYAKVIAQSVHDDFAKIDKKLNKR